MLKKSELTKIKKALPKNGYALVAEASGFSKETVRMCLSEERRYNETIIVAALEVIDNAKAKAEALKAQIKSI